MSEKPIHLVWNLEDFLLLCVEDKVSVVEITFKTHTGAKGGPVIVSSHSKNELETVTVPVVANYTGIAETMIFRYRQELAGAQLQYMRIKDKKEDLFALLHHSQTFLDQLAEKKVTDFYRSWHLQARGIGFPQKYVLDHYSHIYPSPRRIPVHSHSFDIQPSIGCVKQTLHYVYPL